MSKNNERSTASSVLVSVKRHRKIHCFERAGLGKAPFRFVGMSREVYQAVPGDPSCPIQPGTSCDFCGTGIMLVCRIQSADGKTFKVGCDCVAKTGDAGLRRQASEAQRKHERKLRWAREARAELKLAERVGRCAAVLVTRPELFADKPHSHAYWASKGKTRRDELGFLLRHGKRQAAWACKQIEDAA